MEGSELGERWQRTILWILAVFTLLTGVTSPRAHAQDESSRLVVRQSETGYTVLATQVEVARALRAVGERAGFVVVDSAARSVIAPSVEIANASLEAVLGRLLANSNHLIVYRSETNRVVESGAISKIILLSAPDRETPRSAAPIPGANSSEISPLAGPGSTAKSRLPEGWGALRARRAPAAAEEDLDEDLELDDDLEFDDDPEFEEEFFEDLDAMGDGVPDEIADDAAGLGDPRRIGRSPEPEEDQLDYDREGVSARPPGLRPDLPSDLP